MFVAVLALVAASAAPATAPADPAPAAPVVKEKKICVAQDAVTGSITPKRVCKTKAEWDALMGRGPAKQQSAGNQPNPTPANGAND